MASKQPQEPAIGDGSLHVGDRVVYPNQGICRITGVEVKQISGQDWEVVTMSREEDGATVMVPKAKVMGIGLRKVAQSDEIDRDFDMRATLGPPTPIVRAADDEDLGFEDEETPAEPEAAPAAPAAAEEKEEEEEAPATAPAKAEPKKAAPKPAAKHAHAPPKKPAAPAKK